MAETKTVIHRSAVSAGTLLGVLFVALKLTHVIDWSWWWVTLPFWLGWGVVLLVIAFAAAVAGLAFVIVGLAEWSEKRTVKK
jgi:hypothetical protein